MNTYRSFTLNGVYRTSPPGSQVHKDAENSQTFDSFEALAASQAYKDHIAEQAAIRAEQEAQQ